MKNNLQQMILDVIEEMDVAGVYGSLPSTSETSGDNLYNQDTYSKGYHGIPFKNAVQKRKFPELINTKTFNNKKQTNLKSKKTKFKKIKHGKQK